jgi:CHAT domain
MSRHVAFILIAFVFGLAALVNTTKVVGQAGGIRRYPAEEYYTSLKKLRDGKLPEAQHGMETALQKARHARDAVGIDAVPVMMRIGECLCLQGFYEEGLAQIDAALALSKRSRRWTQLLRPNPFSIRGFGNESRGIVWHTVTRKTQLGTFPDAWPVALGTGEILHELSSENLSSGEIVRFDVFESYLAQARGLWLRNQAFKTIAPDLPETREAADAFPELRADVSEPILRSHHICRGLALIGKGELEEAKKLLKESLEVQGGWDHPLTAVGLLGLGEIAFRQNETSASYALLMDASVYFSRHEQFEWLVDVAEMLATVGALERRRAPLEDLEQMSAWAKPRSYLAQSGTMGSAAMLAIDLANDMAAETLAAQSLRSISKSQGPTLRTREQATFVQARLALKRGSFEDGLAKLEAMATSLKGNEGTGPQFSYLIELRRILALLRNGQSSSEKLTSHLNRLLDGPSKEAWRIDPMESYAAILLDLTPYAEAWLETIERLNDPKAMILAFDRLQSIKQRQRLPMSARDLDLRLLFHSPSSRWVESTRTELFKLRKSLPNIDQSSNAIELQIEKASSIKSIDSKKWTAEEKTIWSQLAKQCDDQESRLMEACTQRRFIPQVFPEKISIHVLSERSPAVLGFFRSSKNFYGFALIDGTAETWIIERPEEAAVVSRNLSKSLGLTGSSAQVLETIARNEWMTTANLLRKAIVPDPIWKRLASSSQLAIVPDDWLWYVPFEVFPILRERAEHPLIVSCAVRYATTPSLINSAKPSANLRSLIVQQPLFFANEKETNRLLVEDLQTVMGDAQQVESPSKAHATRWSRIQFDRVVVAATTKTQLGQPFAAMAYDSQDTASLRMWLRLPMHSPSMLALIGNDMPTGRTSEAHGIEVSRVLFALAASGNRTLLLNRWPSRGESSQLLMRSYFESSQDLSPSNAWRRSVLSLWSTPLIENNEFLLAPERTNRESTLENLRGRHPIFWANMMVVEQ